MSNITPRRLQRQPRVDVLELADSEFRLRLGEKLKAVAKAKRGLPPEDKDFVKSLRVVLARGRLLTDHRDTAELAGLHGIHWKCLRSGRFLIGGKR